MLETLQSLAELLTAAGITSKVSYNCLEVVGCRFRAFNSGAWRKPANQRPIVLEVDGSYERSRFLHRRNGYDMGAMVSFVIGALPKAIAIRDAKVARQTLEERAAAIGADVKADKRIRVSAEDGKLKLSLMHEDDLVIRMMIDRFIEFVGEVHTDNALKEICD